MQVYSAEKKLITKHLNKVGIKIIVTSFSIERYRPDSENTGKLNKNQVRHYMFAPLT